MKGKGKNMSVESKDKTEANCPLQFPDIKSVDPHKECPVYSAILEMEDRDTVRYEELDGLQTDLETLLSAVAKRMRVLESEIQTLASWQDKKTIKVPEPPPPPPTSGKRGKAIDEKPSKKMKTTGKGSATGPKNKNMPAIVAKPEIAEGVESPPTEILSRFPKNDTPNRFWTSIEPYCSDITQEDMKLLEDILKSHEEDSDHFKIPPLGKHYSQRWAQEDLLDEQSEGGKILDRRKSYGSSTDGRDLMKRGDESYEDSSVFGPLTQRLVSALIEENVMTPVDDTSMGDAGKDLAEFNASMSPRSLAKQLNLGNMYNLERRIRKELEESGILDADDRPEDTVNPEDEVHMELKRKIGELRAVSQHNLLMTRRLMRLAKEELNKQDMRKKIAAADAEVMDAYRRIQATKAKKKSPSKKEKDMAIKALKERAAVVKAYESMTS